MSEPGTARTVESAPEDITDPRVVSPSPSQLTVSWEIPEFPNGEKLYTGSLSSNNLNKV